MLVDLNLSVVSGDSFTSASVEMEGGGVRGGGGCEDRKKVLELSSNQVESSGSFNSSSVVNVDANNATPGDEDSCSNNADVFAYSFQILTDEQRVKKMVFDDESNDGTIQLFPAGSGGVNSVAQCLSSRKQWLDVGGREAEYGGLVEKIVAQVQQRPQAKKNRRGPRSKSSQYRGVTFYRRTGRWESHIWSVLLVG